MAGHRLRGETLKRTLIVGLGSSGLRILEAFEDYWYERFGNKKTSLVKLINIETDAKNTTKPSDGETMISEIFVHNYEKKFDKLANDIKMTYDPKKELKVEGIPWGWDWTEKINWHIATSTAGTKGAGGIRAGGRLILYSKGSDKNVSQASHVFYRMRDSMGKAWDSLNLSETEVKKRICRELGFSDEEWSDEGASDDPSRSTANPNFDENPNVVVVGSLTGGTCSGMFIDIGYILRHLLGMDKDTASAGALIGMFLIPPVDQQRLEGEAIDFHRANANTFGSVYEFRKLAQKFIDDGVTKKRDMDMPYGMVYLAAPEYSIGEPSKNYMASLETLVRMTALRLFVYCLGFQRVADAEWVDSLITSPGSLFFSFGTGAVVFPKYTLIQAGANEILRRFCERLTNKDVYFDVRNREVKLDEGVAMRRAEERVGQCSDVVFEALTRDPEQEGKSSVIAEHESWAKNLVDREVRAEVLTREFDGATGYYRNLLEANKKTALDRAKAFIEEDVVSEINSNVNIYSALMLLEKYKLQLSRTRKLLEVQGAHTFYDRYQGNIDRIVSAHGALKRIDQSAIAFTHIDELYRQFVLGYEVEVLKSLEKLVTDWSSKLTECTESLNSRAAICRSELQRNINRLTQNDDEVNSPVFQVFFSPRRDPDDPDYLADYLTMKQGVLGAAEAPPSWEHFQPETDPVKFYKGVMKGSLPLDDMFRRLLELLGTSLVSYLHPTDGSEGFSIITKALDNANTDSINGAFRKIDSGFLKRTRQRERGRIPRYLISDGNKEDLARVASRYNLSVGDVKTSYHSTPLIEDMIVFTRDIPFVQLDQIEKFDALKEAFLNHGFADISVFQNDIDKANECWTLLRLTLDGAVDYSLVEKTKADILDNILDFMEFFWLDETPQPKGAERSYEVTKGDLYSVPRAKLGADGRPVSDGCYMHNGAPKLYFEERGAGEGIDIGLHKRDRRSLSRICQHDGIYRALVELLRKHTPVETKSKREAFVSNLYRHYKSNRMNAISSGGRVEKSEQYFSKIVLDDADNPVFDTDKMIRDKCVTGNIIKLLTE